MKQTVIATGTVTYALKGRDLLRRTGYKAEMSRMKHGLSEFGCGYGIVTDCPAQTAERLLRQGQIKVLHVTETA